MNTINIIYTGNILSLINNNLPDGISNNTHPTIIFSNELYKVSFFDNDTFLIDKKSFQDINCFLLKTLNSILKIISNNDFYINQTDLINKFLYTQFISYKNINLGTKEINIYYMLKYLLDFLYEASFLDLNCSNILIKNQSIVFIDRNINMKIMEVCGYNNNKYFVLNDYNSDIFFNREISSHLNIFINNEKIKSINEEIHIDNQFKKLLLPNIDKYKLFINKLIESILN